MRSRLVKEEARGEGYISISRKVRNIWGKFTNMFSVTSSIFWHTIWVPIFDNLFPGGSVSLNRTPPALKIFHHLLGGGGGVEHPLSISVPIGRTEKRKKRSKARQKWLRNNFNPMIAQVKIVASRGQKCPNFRAFRDWRITFRKTSNIPGIIRANLKTAFERELNSQP